MKVNKVKKKKKRKGISTDAPVVTVPTASLTTYLGVSLEVLRICRHILCSHSFLSHLHQGALRGSHALLIHHVAVSHRWSTGVLWVRQTTCTTGGR